MDVTAAISILTAILGLLPDLGVSSSSTIGKFITIVENFLPLVRQEAAALVPVVKNIIAALSSTGAATPDQLAALAALDAQVDQAFESAAVAAGAPADSTGTASTTN